jgi:hypothetical protein
MQFITHQRVPQRDFEQAPLLGIGMHGGRIAQMLAAPGFLGAIHGEVGAADQRLGIVAVLRRRGRADAGADEQGVVVHHIRL